MSKTDSAVQLLIEAGVLTTEDASNVATAKVEVLLTMMVEKQALLPTEVQQARKVLQELETTTNPTRRMRAQMTLVQLITSNLHRRMDKAGQTLRLNKERITSGHYPAVSAAAPAGTPAPVLALKDEDT